MADPRNPYMPSGMDQLSTMLMALGSGIAGAAGSGRSGWEGIAPGVAMYSHALNNANQNAIQYDQWSKNYALQESYRKAQEEKLKAEAEDRQTQNQITRDLMTGMGIGSGIPGMSAPTPSPTIGPGPSAFNIGNVRPVGGGPNSGFQQPASFDDGVALSVKNAGAYPSAFNGGQPMNLMQIGERWAPRGDGNNDPKAWAFNVARFSGLDPSQPLDLRNPQTAAAFARGVHGAEKGAGAVRPIADYLPGVQLAQGGNPQIVPPQQNTTVLPPRVDPLKYAPLALSKTLAPFGQAMIGIGNSETDRYMKDLDRQQKEQQFRQEQALRERTQNATERNQDVVLGPDGQPQVNKTVIDAKAAVSAVQGTDTTGKMLLGDYEDVRKANTEIQSGAMTARNGLMQTNRLAGLLDRMATTGKFTSSTQQIKQMAKGIGVDLEALGIKDDTAPAQAVEALRGQMALALRNPAGGAGMPGAMSDADRNYLDRMVAGLENTPEGNKLIISASRKVYQRQIDVARIANDFMRSPEAKKDPNALYQKLQDYADKNPLFDEKDLPPPTQAAPGALPVPNPDGTPRVRRWNPDKGALE